ncbi:tektin-2 isoform X1 [Anguilla rostrata]|uniref:tektin-2 isoform X1 n=2 Tax=Anguilla rostrata TaxID=7938 RepID=UPI0030D27DFD
MTKPLEEYKNVTWQRTAWLVDQTRADVLSQFRQGDSPSVTVKMATLSIKPGHRYSVPDWETSNRQIADTAGDKRNVSHEVRQEARTLRNETSNKTFWDKSDNSRRLRDRITDLSRWKENLAACAREVDAEMEALTLTKEELERTLAATALPLEVAVECLTLRERRRGTELVNDPVEAELKKEVEVIGGIQRTLQHRISKAFEQICLLQEARHQLTCDIQNKMDALDVDGTSLLLTETSRDISLKPNPMRMLPGFTSPQQWELFSRSNVSRAREEMQASQQLRGDMKLTKAQVLIELQAQHMATDFALRKRAHQLERACDEMAWQLKQTKDEMTELEQDIRGLEEDLVAKTAPLKLVHTRLENRTMRPGADLCRDEVHFGLVEEAQQLEATIRALKEKLAQAQHSLQALQQHQACMGEDLSRKQDALTLEQRSLETRQRLVATAQTELTPSAVVPLANSSGRHALDLL